MPKSIPVAAIMSKKQFQEATYLSFHLRPSILKEIDALLDSLENLEKPKATPQLNCWRTVSLFFSYKPPKITQTKEEILELLSNKLFDAGQMIHEGIIHKKRLHGIEELERKVLYEIDFNGKKRNPRTPLKAYAPPSLL